MTNFRKSYWRLMYFLNKNNTVVESMTHAGIDLHIAKQKIKGIANIKHVEYEVANVTESQLYRTKMAFSFYLTTEVGYNQTTKVESDLKTTWLNKMKGIYCRNMLCLKCFFFFFFFFTSYGIPNFFFLKIDVYFTWKYLISEIGV
jgi:hypothetical protein